LFHASDILGSMGDTFGYAGTCAGRLTLMLPFLFLVERKGLNSNTGALGKTPLQATMEAMQELMDNHPREYQQALRHIDIDHNFFFDIETDDSLDFILTDAVEG